MRIAVCAQSKGKDAPVDPRFGRCAYYVVFDTETNEVNSMQNPAQAAGGGAGIQAAEFLQSNNVDVVLAGNIGPNAASVLAAGNIDMYTGITGTVAESLEMYENEQLQRTDDATVGPKHGGGQTRPGRGGGRGRRRK
jgi:predicted Fe-Mo cluster-binding NifX family protein